MIKLLVGCYSPCTDPKANTACFFRSGYPVWQGNGITLIKLGEKEKTYYLQGEDWKLLWLFLLLWFLKEVWFFFCLFGFGFVFPSVWGKYSNLKTFCFERVLEETNHKRSFVVKVCFIFVWCWVFSRGFFSPVPNNMEHIEACFFTEFLILL